MNQPMIEMLFTKKETNDENIKEIFENSISDYLKGAEIQYQTIDKSYLFKYNSIVLDDSLFVSIKLYPDTIVTQVEIAMLQEIREKLKKQSSIKHLSSTTLSDDTSLYFIERLVPYIHKYEWALRKLIYLFLRRNFKNKWITESVSNEDIKGIKKRSKGNYDESNILQEVTLFHLENYLFGENYISVKTEGEDSYVINFKEVDHSFLLELLGESNTSSSPPVSLWNQHFNKYVEKKSPEIKSDVENIRVARNAAGHNKEIKESQFEKWIISLQTVIEELEVIFNSILEGTVTNEELEIASEDFDKYISINSISKLNLSPLKSNFNAVDILRKDNAILSDSISKLNLSPLKSNFNAVDILKKDNAILSDSISKLNLSPLKSSLILKLD